MSMGAGVIKAGSRRRVPGCGPRPFHFDDLSREAEAATAQARAEASRLVTEAQAQADAIRSEAREQGRREGYEQGLEQGRGRGRTEAFEAAQKEFAERHATLAAACQEAVAQIEADRVQWQAAGRRDLVELAMAIARRVVRHVGQRERDVVRANLEEAVQLAGRRTDVTIRVNPEDLATAEQFAASLVEAMQQCEHVAVQADAEISPGGCRVQWGSGAVDARLETQLDRMAAELLTGPEPAAQPEGETEDA